MRMPLFGEHLRCLLDEVWIQRDKLLLGLWGCSSSLALNLQSQVLQEIPQNPFLAAGQRWGGAFALLLRASGVQTRSYLMFFLAFRKKPQTEELFTCFISTVTKIFLLVVGVNSVLCAHKAFMKTNKRITPASLKWGQQWVYYRGVLKRLLNAKGVESPGQKQRTWEQPILLRKTKSSLFLLICAVDTLVNDNAKVFRGL